MTSQRRLLGRPGIRLSDNGIEARTWLNNLIFVLPVFIAIIPTDLLHQKYANPSSPRHWIPSSEREIKFSSSLVYVLHKM